MKVFTNTNFATGKASLDIEANVFVALSNADGNVITANSDTPPIGVSHNNPTPRGSAVTIVPTGAGFARVKAGQEFTLADLGAVVGSNALGFAIKNPSFGAGILAGLSADAEGAIAAEAGDDVVVLLDCCAAPSTSATDGYAKFVVTSNVGSPVSGAVITLFVAGSLAQNITTDASGIAIFNVPAGQHSWSAVSSGNVLTTSSGDVVVVAGATATVNILATPAAGVQGTLKFVVNTGGTGVSEVDVTIDLPDRNKLSGKTDENGIKIFTLDADIYPYLLSKTNYTFVPTTDSATVTAGAETLVEVAATYGG